MNINQFKIEDRDLPITMVAFETIKDELEQTDNKRVQNVLIHMALDKPTILLRYFCRTAEDRPIFIAGILERLNKILKGKGFDYTTFKRRIILIKTYRELLIPEVGLKEAKDKVDELFPELYPEISEV